MVPVFGTPDSSSAFAASFAKSTSAPNSLMSPVASAVACSFSRHHAACTIPPHTLDELEARLDRVDVDPQEALVRAWRDLPGLRDPERFDAWLHRLLVHACYDESQRTRSWRGSVTSLPIELAGVLFALLSGYSILLYTYVKSAYPATMTGRALSLYTMAMFLGVALMQWGTGVAASIAAAHGADPLTAVLGTIAVLLLAGIAAFAWLPAPKNSSA